MSFSISQLLTAIVVLVVVVMWILFLTGFNLDSLSNLLPNFGDANEDKIIENVVGDKVVSEEFKECIKDAFWADENKNKIEKGGEILGEASFVLEIGDIEKCKGKSVSFYKNGEYFSGLVLSEFGLNNLEKTGNFYYKKYSFENGAYSFKILDNLEKEIFGGYEVKVTKTYKINQ